MTYKEIIRNLISVNTVIKSLCKDRIKNKYVLFVLFSERRNLINAWDGLVDAQDKAYERQERYAVTGEY